MKTLRSIIFLFSFLPFFPQFLQAQTKVTELAVVPSKVTVHLKGAELVQTANAQVPADRHQIIFTGLSPKVNPQSIQVTATNGVEILSITSKVNFLKPGKQSDKIKSIQDSLEQITRQKQAVTDERMAYEEEKDLLQKNKMLSGRDASLPVDELVRAADFYRARFREINQALSSLRFQNQKLDAEMGRLRQQLAELNAHQRPTSEVYVDINSKASVNSEFRLRYVVDNAGWSPIYDLVSMGLNEPISLKYRALAFNDTGVDWDDVAIRLSTADPYAGAGQPALAPWVLTLPKISGKASSLGFGQLNGETRERNQLEILQQSQNLNFNFQQDTGADVIGAGGNLIAFEAIEISELSTDFDIEEPYSIPADRRPYSIEIMEHKLEATYKHFAIPKVDKDAFLLAQVTGWEELDLISGPMNVYRNENFIGLAQLSTRTLSDTLELSLGRDKNVILKRTKLKDFSKKKFFGGNKITSFTHQISVKNNHRSPITIEIQDQVPISKVKEIEVSIKETSGARHINESGKLIWEKSIAPGDVSAMKFGVEIKHPKNMEVVINKKGRQMLSPRYF